MENSVKSLSIKIGRTTYSFEDGHTFYDNGSCIQSQTFRVKVDKWSDTALKITKAAWAKLETSCNVKKYEPNGNKIWVLKLAYATPKVGPTFQELKEELATIAVENNTTFLYEAFNSTVGGPYPQLDAVAKNNLDKKVSYRKNGELILGTIKGLMFDKRVNAEYYRVETKNGKIKHVRTNKLDLVYHA